MNKKVGFIVLIALQLVILIAMFVKAFYPLWLGEDIVLKVVARDPRDIFAGNYVVLNYSFNTIDTDSVKTDLDSTDLKNLHVGDKLYLELTKQGKYYEPLKLWKEKPSTANKVMRVLVERESYNKMVYLKGGIESYFTTHEHALALEKMTSWQESDSVTVEVTVKVAPDGASRIAQVMPVKK